MSADDFFSRWSRRAAEAKANAAPVQEKPVQNKSAVPAEAQAPAVPEAPRDVTLEDVAALTKDSDYSAFVAKGVDETVKRSAMKKLFSDPHFNVMDGLDIYIDDYSVFQPITPAVLAMMEHAKPLLDPLGHLQNSMMSLVNAADEEKDKAVPESGAEAEAETEIETDTLVLEHSAMEQEIIPSESGESVEAALADQPPAEPSSLDKPAEC